MLQLLIAATIALFLVMAAGWAFQKTKGNGGWTDVFWTFGTGAAGLALSIVPLDGQPVSKRQLLVAGLVLAWSLRLGLHIAFRVAGSPEDARYAELRRVWGPRFQRNMALFLPAQAIVSAPLLVSVVLAARNPAPGLGITDLLGASMLAAAVLGEAAADRQLDRFRARAMGQRRICDEGLWAWSRHPNYFFEWLGWLAYPLIAFDPTGRWPVGLAALAGPLAMYLILNFATGLPPLEAHMLRSRGEAFRDYQRRTSAFFPLPPRSKGARP